MTPVDPKLFDIKKNFSSYSTLWNGCMDYIKINCKTDPLYENYLSIDLDKFDCFIAMIDQDQIICFGGVEHNPNKWGEEISRVLTRFWIKPTHRTKGLTKWRSESIKYSPLILKSQMEFLYNQNKVKSAMITREGRYKNSFREIIRLANTVSNYNFYILSNRYNVCEPAHKIPESCQQMVALCSFTRDTPKSIFARAQSLGHFKEIV